MADYIEIDEARTRPGLRLVLTEGVPGPFGEAAKAIFHVKKIAYLKVRQTPGESDEALAAWTAQTSAPVAVYEDERPRSGWADILYLAERVAPEPRLIPDDPAQRVQMFGLCNEITGERGFGWQRRLMLLHPLLAAGQTEGVPALLGRKYGYSQAAGEAAPDRTREILALLSSQLRDQKSRGSRYFLGDSLSAVDLYWATFAAMLEPLPKQLCPMDDFMRRAYLLTDPEIRKAADPLLLEHRDAIYADYLELPLDF
jgi:glutathione S-transferase